MGKKSLKVVVKPNFKGSPSCQYHQNGSNQEYAYGLLSVHASAQRLGIFWKGETPCFNFTAKRLKILTFKEIQSGYFWPIHLEILLSVRVNSLFHH